MLHRCIHSACTAPIMQNGMDNRGLGLRKAWHGPTVKRLWKLLDDRGKNEAISDHPSAHATFMRAKRDGKK